MKHFALILAATALIAGSAYATLHGKHHAGILASKAHTKTHYTTNAITANQVRGQPMVDYFASEGIGQTVYNSDMAKIATVSDMGLTENGKVTFVILDIDGLENSISDDVAVPYSAFSWNEDGNKLMLDMNKDALASVGK